ncbi:MAG: AMP-binding protein [Legionella sp.]
MDKRWFEHYEKGVPHEIDSSQYSSLVALFKESCSRYAKQPSYCNMGSCISFAELDQLSRNFAAYLQQLNLEKGARVAIMLPNLIQYPVALFGILRAGFVVVNTNPLYTTDELVHQLNDSGAEAIVVLANFAKTIEKGLSSIPSLKHIIVTELGELFPTIKRIIVNSVVKYIKKLVPAYHIPHAVAFHYALLEGKQAPLHHVELNHDDIAFLQYTGGTTGVAKGAILTHGNMVSNVLQANVWIKPISLDGDEIIITAIPLYHVFSLTANCLTYLKEGAKNILITNPRDVDGFIKEIKDIGFSTITGVNTLFNSLLNHPKFKEVNFSRLKVSLAGGMALQKSVAVKWLEITKSPILEAYGLTETSPAAVMNPMNLTEYNGSVGLPLPSTDVVILDDDEREVPIGTSGEICIKGPQVTPGYWKRPDETALVFTKNGYLKTGDIGKMDEEGFVYIVDRKKDMLIVSGFNVYPNEIEQVIGMHPGVLEVGVVGIADPESGERVKACIVKKDHDLTKEQVISYCREHLTAYKVPKVVEFYTELPKTNVGKILRRALKDTHESTSNLQDKKSEVEV